MFNISNIIVILIISLILGCAIFYILRAKKKGVKCIGCDSSKSCGCSLSTQKDKDSTKK